MFPVHTIYLCMQAGGLFAERQTGTRSARIFNQFIGMKQKTTSGRDRRICWMALLACLAIVATADAKVKLPALLSDGMVLQREQPVKLWGTADAGEMVEVRFVRADVADGRKTVWPVTVDGRRMKTACADTADAQGRWCVTLPPLKPGGPYVLQVNDIRLTDVLVGDVWLCSGQSNMELPVSRVIEKFADEVAVSENPQIRHITVPRVYDFRAPQSGTRRADWKSLSPKNAPGFSALAYFFAKALYEKTGVPVGLVNASWGGTPIESWISEEGLADFPLYVHTKRLYESDAYRRQLSRMNSESTRRWYQTLWQGDPGLHASVPWYADAYDDGCWQTVDMFSTEWGNNGLNVIRGSHWLRKTVSVPQRWLGREVTLRLGCIVDADSVYVNGTLVGSTGNKYLARVYRIPAGLLRAGENHIAVRIISKGGQPAFVPDKPYKLICSSAGEKVEEELSLEGNWKYRLGSPMPPAPSLPPFFYKPVCVYNGMIAPLRHCVFRGVIWYQGEANVERRNEYAALLSAMMADWRRTFAAPSLPFYIVELADFLPYDDVEGRRAWAEMREVQARAASADEHATLIKNRDLGEWNDVHPQDKKTLGIRVAEAVWNDMQKD